MVENDVRNDIIAQTAKLRFSVRSEGLQDLLRQRGLDPNRCFQVSCNQGDDVCICLVLPDGTIVDDGVSRTLPNSPGDSASSTGRPKRIRTPSFNCAVR